MEIMIVTVIMGLISATVYGFFRNYLRSYVKIDEKLESITEAWQILRALKDDLAFCDFPDGNPENWREAVKKVAEGYQIIRRRGDKLEVVLYRVDQAKGDIFREESGKINGLLRNRCQEFQIEFRPRLTGGALVPDFAYVHVQLVLANRSKSKEASTPFSFTTNMVPTFLNLRLNHKYLHRGFPQ